MQVPGVMRWVELIEAFPTRFLFGSAVMGQFSDISGQHNACAIVTPDSKLRIGYLLIGYPDASPAVAHPSHRQAARVPTGTQGTDVSVGAGCKRASAASATCSTC